MGLNQTKDSSSLYDSIIFFKVGPENTSFGIHRGLLCHHSSYFDRALNGFLEEVVEGEVILADEDPATFTRFNEWLYTGVFLFGNETEKNVTCRALARLYSFAEEHGVIRLQNAITDCIIKKNVDHHTTPKIQYIWKTTADSSPLRTLLVDLYVRKMDFAGLMDDEKKRSRFDKDTLVAIVLAFYHLKNDYGFLSRIDFWKNRCLYHVHNDSVPPCQPGLETGLSAPSLTP